MKKFLLRISAVVGLVGLSLFEAKAQSFVMVYLDAWGIRNCVTIDTTQLVWQGMTHLIIFKIDPIANPPYYAWDGFDGSISEQQTVIRQAHRNGVKVLLCIGGVGGQWYTFSRDSATCQRTVDAIAAYARSVGYDGLDLDWESNLDYNGFFLLSRILRRKMDSWSPAGTLTAAVGRETWGASYTPILNTYYDYLNIMNYDQNSYWSGHSGFHEQIYNAGATRGYPDDFSVDVHSRTWIRDGLNKSKTSLSISSYAWVWTFATGITAPWQRYLGGGTAWCCPGVGEITERFISQGGTVAYDTIAKMHWWSNPNNPSLGQSYMNWKGERGTRESFEYIVSQGWGGVMLFTLDQGTLGYGTYGRRTHEFESWNTIRNLLLPPSPSPPSFLTQPTNKSVWVGSFATFTANATGFPTPTLQWQKNNVNIPGATNANYTTPATVLNDNGSTFRCIASNSQGTVTSNSAILTVSVPTIAGPRSDDFSNPIRFNSLWVQSHPNITSLIGANTSDALLQFNLDATPHDMWVNTFEAPRVLQGIINGDFEVVAKFQSVPTATYQFQGVIVKESATSWLRIDVLRDIVGLKLFAAHITNTASNVKINSSISISGTQVWLKVKREADFWTAAYSTDNATFTQAGQFSHPFVVDSIGIFAGNAANGGSVPTFDCKVDYFFNTLSPISPEDPANDITASGTPIALITNPAGAGSKSLEVIRDGVIPTVGGMNPTVQYDTFNGDKERQTDWIGYAFPTTRSFGSVLFQEGVHAADGGYFTVKPTIEIRVGGQWIEASGVTITPIYNSLAAPSFTSYAFRFNQTSGDGIRVIGAPGGSAKYISVAELRVYSDSSSPLPPEQPPKSYFLLSNYPNPFNNSTTIQFTIPVASQVTIAIFDVLGKKVRTLVDGVLSQGTYPTIWDGQDENGIARSSGVYVLRMQSGGFTEMQKMVLAK